MPGAHPLVGADRRPHPITPAHSAGERRLIGRVAGVLIVSRAVVASGASALILLYHQQPGSETGARVAVTILLIMGVGAIVTLLREALQRRQRELENLALQDPLTGVGNYRLLAERLDYELARHRR